MQEAKEKTQGGVSREKGRAMFQHLLVLLDGSARAELALPFAVRLVRATGASLTLVRMVTLPSDFTWSKLEPPFRDREILTTEMLQASTYLKGKTWELERAGIDVQAHLLPDLAFPQLQALSEEQGIDLLVMCGYGQRACRPDVRNSTVWHALQRCQASMLVLQETVGPAGTLSYRGTHPVRIIVPLDGSVLAETVLTPAAFLATALSTPETGTLHLVSVIPFAPVSQTGESVWHDRLAYLQATARVLRAGDMGHGNLSVTVSVLTHPDVADTLVHTAEMKQPRGETAQAEAACDLLALTTHGCSGLRHQQIGSIATRLLQETHLPFLAVHPPLGVQPASQVRSTALASHQREVGNAEEVEMARKPGEC